MILGVVGAPDFDDYLLLKRKLDRWVSRLNQSKLVVIIPQHKGFYQLVDRWAYESRTTLQIYHEEKRRPGRHIEQMLDSVQVLIVCGTDPDLNPIILEAHRREIPIRTIAAKE